MTTQTAAKPVSANRTMSLTDRAYRELEERIVTLDLAPGSVLSEAQLSEQLNIGRTPIREALQRLAREGLIVILPRKGILVSDINPSKQLLVLEVRREIERMMARAGAERRSEDERQAFLEIAAGMEQAARDNDDIAFLRFDTDFNVLLAQASHNEYAVGAIDLLNGLSRRFWYLHYKKAADMPLMARLHASVAKAIADGNADAAAAASDALVDYVEAFTRATVGGA
jgi:DNA-binding GntR family transcriptional regulator